MIRLFVHLQTFTLDLENHSSAAVAARLGRQFAGESSWLSRPPRLDGSRVPHGGNVGLEPAMRQALQEATVAARILVIGRYGC